MSTLDDAPHSGKVGVVRIVYMHGRIPQGGKPRGKCVLTEADYASTRERFSRRVRKLLMREKSAFLILGSSLVDPPLVDALASTARSGKNARVALYPLLPTGVYKHSDYHQALDLLRSRCQHLGLDVLFPDFLFQVPEFCKELGLAMGYKDPAQHINGPERYGKRLDNWWTEFEPTLANPDRTSEVMLDTLIKARAILSQRREPPEDEIYRLDLWLRDTPRDRHLVQWGSSVGPIREKALLRRQELDLRSRHATIRGFQSGHPRLYNLEDLGLDEADETMRWKHFLVVPVLDAVSKDGPMLPVGAATLCASSGSPETLLNAKPKEMSGVVQLLRSLANRLKAAAESEQSEPRALDADLVS